MQAGGAGGDREGMANPLALGEGLLERRDLRALGQPA